MKNLYVLLFLVFSFQSYLIAQSKDLCPSYNRLDKARKHHENKPEKALKLYNKILKSYPKCAVVYYQIGVLNKLTNKEAALKYFELSKLYGGDIKFNDIQRYEILEALAEEMILKRDYEKSIFYLEALLKSDEHRLHSKKKIFRILKLESNTAVENGDYVESLRILDKLSLLLPEKKEEVVKEKIKINRILADQELRSGNYQKALEFSQSNVDNYKLLGEQIHCDNYTRRAKIHFKRFERKKSRMALNEQLVLIDDLLAFPSKCKSVKRIQGQIRSIRKQVLFSLAQTEYRSKQFLEALEYVVQLLPTTDSEIKALHNDIIEQLALEAHEENKYEKAFFYLSKITEAPSFSIRDLRSLERVGELSRGFNIESRLERKKNEIKLDYIRYLAYKKRDFDRSLYTMEEIRSQNSLLSRRDKFKDLYDRVRCDYAEVLMNKASSEISMKRAVLLCNEVLRNHNSEKYRIEALRLRKSAYLNLVEIHRNTENDYELLDYINRLKLEYPNDSLVKELRASVLIDFGKKLHQNRNYDFALFYHSEAERSKTKYAPIAAYNLGKLLEANFQVRESKEKMREVLQSNANSTVRQKANSTLARYNAILRDKEEVLNYLYNYYCSYNYDFVREQISKDNSYYNLQNDPRFQRWLNGIRRLKIHDISCEISFNPDSDENFDWGPWRGPDLLLEIFGERSGYCIGDYTPSWKNWSAVRDFSLDRKNTLNITLYDYDPYLTKKARFEYVGAFSTTMPCKPGRYEFMTRTYNGTVKFFYRVSDSNEAPYTMSYIYGGKSGLQIGFEASLCILKKFLNPESFFFVTLAEGVLVDKSIENSTGAIENALVKTAIKTAKGILPAEIRQILRAYGITKCLYDAVQELEKSGWVKKNYTADGKRIIA